MEATIIAVQTGFGEIGIVSVYKRPAEYVEVPDGNQGVLMEDGNAKSIAWNSRYLNIAGRKLTDIAYAYDRSYIS